VLFEVIWELISKLHPRLSHYLRNLALAVFTIRFYGCKIVGLVTKILNMTVLAVEPLEKPDPENIVLADDSSFSYMRGQIVVVPVRRPPSCMFHFRLQTVVLAVYRWEVRTRKHVIPDSTLECSSYHC